MNALEFLDVGLGWVMLRGEFFHTKIQDVGECAGIDREMMVIVRKEE